MTVETTPLAGCPCGDPNGPLCPDCLAYETQKSHEKFMARLQVSSLPEALQDFHIAEAVPGPAADAASAWARGELGGLCLTGDVGVGKSWLAAAATWERLQTHGVRWVPAARLMTELRSGFNSKAKEQADQIITSRGAIVLDDLDKVNPTEYGREVMFAVIDGRIEAGAPLLVTTNAAISEIALRLGDPIASRLAGYCQVVRMTGRDRRLAK